MFSFELYLLNFFQSNYSLQIGIAIVIVKLEINTFSTTFPFLKKYFCLIMIANLLFVASFKLVFMKVGLTRKVMRIRFLLVHLIAKMLTMSWNNANYQTIQTKCVLKKHYCLYIIEIQSSVFFSWKSWKIWAYLLQHWLVPSFYMLFEITAMFWWVATKKALKRRSFAALETNVCSQAPLCLIRSSTLFAIKRVPYIGPVKFAWKKIRKSNNE